MSSFTVAAILGLSEAPERTPVSLSKEHNVCELPPRNRQRRGRTTFSDAALEKLEDIFTITPYPDINLRESLSHQLSISESRIQVWFQNRRSRGKRNKLRTSLESSSSLVKQEITPMPSPIMPIQDHHYNVPYYYPYSHYPIYYPMMPSVYSAPSHPLYVLPSYGYPIETSHDYRREHDMTQYASAFSSPGLSARRHEEQLPKLSKTQYREEFNLKGISLLTEAARKLSSGSFTEITDLELRNTDAKNDSISSDTCSSTLSLSTSSSNIDSVTSNSSLISADDDDTEDKLFIDC